MKKQKIMVSGMLYSGSGAVVDLLSDYEEVVKVEGEFDDFRRVGLIGDLLDDKINDLYPRKISEYIRGAASYDYVLKSSNSSGNKIFFQRAKMHQALDKLINLLAKLKNYKRKTSTPHRRKRLELMNSFSEGENTAQCLEKANEWMCSIEKLSNENSEYILLDQPIFHGQHLDVWPKMFNPYKLIIVCRDPRDQIAQLIKSKVIFQDFTTCLTHGLQELYGNDLAGAIRYQLDVLSARYDSISKILRKLPNQNVLLISFEHLVENPDQGRNEIIEFITNGKNDLSRNKIDPAFQPEVSARNVGISSEYSELFSQLSFENVYKKYNLLLKESEKAKK